MARHFSRSKGVEAALAPPVGDCAASAHMEVTFVHHKTSAREFWLTIWLKGHGKVVDSWSVALTILICSSRLKFAGAVPAEATLLRIVLSGEA